MKKLTKKEIKAQEIESMKVDLKEMLEKLDDYTVFTENLHTSQSGLLRSIKVYLSDMTDITKIVATIEGYSIHKTGGLRVSGAGMDMGFSVVYNLSVGLYCEDGYDHDSAYKLKHRWI